MRRRWMALAVAGLLAAACTTTGDVEPNAPSGAASPNRRQYYDEQAGRYYYYDSATGRYYWEDGRPRG